MTTIHANTVSYAVIDSTPTGGHFARIYRQDTGREIARTMNHQSRFAAHGAVMRLARRLQVDVQDVRHASSCPPLWVAMANSRRQDRILGNMTVKVVNEKPSLLDRFIATLKR